MRKFDVNAVKQLLESPKKIVITTHFKPDGDAMGSSLGLYNYLIQLNHHVQVVTPSDYPEFLYFLPGNDNVINFEANPEAAVKACNDAELIFCLDFNNASRVERFSETLVNTKATKILIDHHLSPSDFCEYTYSYTDACATAELIYDFILSLDDEKRINEAIATCLYTGIMTDTGSFRFNSATADVHRKVAALMDKGANNAKIHEAVYDNASEERLRLLGYCLSNKLKVMPEYHTAVVWISRDEILKFNHKTGDTEGLVNYALGIKGIKMAAFFTERKDMVKASFRSRGDFSVKDFSEKYFEGGGHKNAAGGSSHLSLEASVEKFISLLPEYKDQLEKA